MWEDGIQKIKPQIDLNSFYLENLRGKLGEKEAKISLVKFLRHNVGLTAELIANVQLLPFQEIAIRTWFKRNYNMAIWGRGCSKSWTVALFVILYLIFNPGVNVVIISSNFRTSRRILEYMEKFLDEKSATLLQQCFNKKMTRRQDSWKWEINGGAAICLPLASGDKIRGTRADVLVVDEFALIPEDIFRGVLMPFLVAKTDAKEQIRIKNMEDDLIRLGKMKEEDRLQFTSKKRTILLSSASFEFEFLYTLFKEWRNNILGLKNDVVKKRPEEELAGASYFISQLSYEVVPEVIIDPAIIEEAKSGGDTNPIFRREYKAQFVDDSASYFSAKKMEACTIVAGEMPSIEIVGDKSAEYIMAIDTNYNSAETSDDFAMNLIKLDRTHRMGYLVHNYAAPGGSLSDHIKYAAYMLSRFNVVMVICDAAGGERFIEACNMSDFFRSKNLKMDFWRADFDVDSEDYNRALQEARNSYNLEGKKIVYLQNFTSPSIRKMNETLQIAIEKKFIWFASNPGANEGLYASLMSENIPELLDLTNQDSYRMDLLDHIDNQSALIILTKKECALVEPKTTPNGLMTFDLPMHLKKSKKRDRARKDCYTCLILGNWAIKVFCDTMAYEPPSQEFVPQWLV